MEWLCRHCQRNAEPCCQMAHLVGGWGSWRFGQGWNSLSHTSFLDWLEKIYFHRKKKILRYWKVNLYVSIFLFTCYNIYDMLQHIITLLILSKGYSSLWVKHTVVIRFRRFILEMFIAIVLVLPNVFIVSYGFSKCIREITRGSVMYRFLTTNELI